MFAGKKIQNFITFQTKQTIYLKQNQPQLIVHQRTIQTDSIKQLLSKRSSKSRSRLFINTFKNDKENLQSNQVKKSSYHKNSRFDSSNSNSNLYSKQKSLGSNSKSKNKNSDRVLHKKDKIKQFDLKENMSKSKSKRDKLSKKAKSMIRLPRYDKNVIQLEKSKNPFDLEKSKIGRKSYSPNRNYSEGMKKTSQNHAISTNKFQCSNQCIKTTKFTESKEANSKNVNTKSSKTEKKIKKKSAQKNKKDSTKEKITSSGILNKATLQNKNSYLTKKKYEDVFHTIDVENNKKVSKKISPSKKIQVGKRKIEQAKPLKYLKQKPGKKRKSMSKSKKNIHFQSVDNVLLRQNDFLNTKQELQFANYLSSRDSIKKKVKTDRDSFNKVKKKHSCSSKQKQVIVSSKNMNKLRNEAATKIQKAYKGYITRKWLSQYLKIISAAVTIQKHWKGYQQRRKLKQIIKNKQNNGLMIKKEAIQAKQLNLQDSKINLDKWKDILFEVMEQKTINEGLKSRIKQFLQNQGGQSGRSSILSSKKSRNSEQKLKSQMMSQKRYFQKKRRQSQEILTNSNKRSQKESSPDSFSIVYEHSENHKAKLPSKQQAPNSPQLISRFFSPQDLQISPKLQKVQSPQTVISNLYEIQNYQKKNIIIEAQNQKNQLQQLLQKNIYSPRTYLVKQKQIHAKMEQSLQQFQKNIKGVIQSCKITCFNNNNNNQFVESIMITPQHSYLKQQKGSLSDDQMISKSFQKVNNDEFVSSLAQAEEAKPQKSQIIQNVTKQQLIPLSVPSEVPTYENFQTFNINALSEQKSQNIASQRLVKIDVSCNFLDQYLLTLIQYLRNKNDGEVMKQIVKSIKSWRNLEAYVVLRNLSAVAEQNSSQDDAFSLPLYKYLQDDAEIIKSEYVSDYNRYFNMMKSANKFLNPHTKMSNQNISPQNQPSQYYQKLLIDSFNQALNLKRPSRYIFTERAIQSFNSQQIVSRQEIDIEQEYDIYCASSMQQIFTWFNVKYGFGINSLHDENNFQQLIIENNQRIQLILKMQAEKKWDDYYEKIQLIAKLSEQLFEDLMIKEVITILNIENKFMKTRQVFT